MSKFVVKLDTATAVTRNDASRPEHYRAAFFLFSSPTLVEMLVLQALSRSTRPQPSTIRCHLQRECGWHAEV
jgi:hypothetical protein